MSNEAPAGSRIAAATSSTATRAIPGLARRQAVYVPAKIRGFGGTCGWISARCCRAMPAIAAITCLGGRRPAAQLSRPQPHRQSAGQRFAARRPAQGRQDRHGAAELPGTDGCLLGGCQDRAGHRADEPVAAGRRPGVAAGRFRQRAGPGSFLLCRHLRAHSRPAAGDRRRSLDPGRQRRGAQPAFAPTTASSRVPRRTTRRTPD